MMRTLRFTCFMFIGMFMSVAVSAQQRQIPLTVSFASPTNNQEVEFGANFYCIISIQNNSTTESLAATDTLMIMFDGEPSFQYSGDILTTFAPAIGPGETAALPIFVFGNNNQTGIIEEKEYCVSAFGFGNVFTTGAWLNSNPSAFDPVCIDFKLMPEVVGTPTSVSELDATAFSIYPNPANEAINISTENMPADAIITVHNAMGQRVFEQKANDFRAMGAINTSSWNSGVYMVSVTSNGACTTQRVTVQH